MVNLCCLEKLELLALHFHHIYLLSSPTTEVPSWCHIQGTGIWRSRRHLGGRGSEGGEAKCSGVIHTLFLPMFFFFFNIWTLLIQLPQSCWDTPRSKAAIVLSLKIPFPRQPCTDVGLVLLYVQASQAGC